MAIRWEAANAVVMTFAAMAVPIAAQERPVQMRVVVQDLATVSPAVIAQAETVVTRIYSQIGVQITWRKIVGFDLCEVAPGPDGEEWNGNVGARLLYKMIGFTLLSQQASEQR